jgi:hypothetical protein
MVSTVRNILVINEINSLKEIVPFGIKHNNVFIEIQNISIDTRGHLFYLNSNNELKSVSSFIIQKKERSAARWLNHLYFIDGYGRQQSFKKYVSQKHTLNFT